MSRLYRDITVTEKIDGTNACVSIVELDGYPAEGCIWQGDGVALYAGSNTRWITPENDNHGFARWVKENAEDLLTLGLGTHFGEWWGSGIQRGYGLPKGEKRWSLFNTARWCLHNQEPGIATVSWDEVEKKMVAKMQQPLPACCRLVPVLYQGPFDMDEVDAAVRMLELGSFASPGFDNPEGIVMFHSAANSCFKKTIKDDEVPKSEVLKREEAMREAGH